MKRKEENRSVIEPSCIFFKPNKINALPSNRVLDRKPDRVTGYKVLIDLTSLINTHYIHNEVVQFFLKWPFSGEDDRGKTSPRALVFTRCDIQSERL